MATKRAIIYCQLLLAALLLSSGARSQEGTGGTNSIFSLGVGARAIGMGGAFSSVGDDASSLAYNPATLVLNRYTQVLASHAELFSGWSDAGYDFVGVVYPTISAGAVGVAVMTVGTGGIRGFDQWSRETEEISYRESQAMLGYAYTLPWLWAGKISIGSSVKLLSQRIGDFSDTGTGLDLGLLYVPKWLPGFNLGCNLQDFVGADIKLVSVSEKVDRTVMSAIGYRRKIAGNSVLALSAQMDMPERGDSRFRAGAEYRFKELFSVRAGYDGESFTAGVGIAWHGLGFDYGYMSRADAGSVHPMALYARIGTSVDDRIRANEERRLAEEERRIKQILSRRIATHLSSAENYRKAGELAKALDELKIALEYDPTDRSIADTMAVIEREILAAEEDRTRNLEKAALINQHFKSGLECYSRGDYIRARAEWRSVLEIDTSNVQASNYLSATQQRLDSLAAHHRARAMELERNGQLAAAIGEWNMVRTIEPDSEEARLAVERLNARVDELGRDYLTAAKRLQVVELYENAVRAFGEGRYQEAVRHLTELLRIDPNHAEARTLLRRAEKRMTPLSEAEKAEIRALYIEGMKHFSKGDYLKAIERWQKILDIDPDNESVLGNIEEARKRLADTNSPEARQ